MKKSLIITLLAVAGILVMKTNSLGQFKTVGYVPNWVNLYTFSDNFDYSRVTHLNIAFKDPSNTAGDIPALSAGEAYLVTSAHNNGVEVFLSLCGGAASTNTTIRNRYFTLINSTNRSNFSKKIKDYAMAQNLDGIDLDLEGPAINSDYGAFVQVLADTLHAAGLKLTSALSEGYGGGNVPNSTFAYFDWINIMAYDAVGPTWGSPGQHSSYQFAVDALDYWKGRGLAKEKAVLGVPFYGYGFGADYQSYAYSYEDIATTHPDYVYDDEAGNTIYYNGINTIIDKTSLAVVEGGGIMIWELSLDATGNNSLLKHIRSTVQATSVQAKENEERFAVYPNPTTGIFTVSGLNDGETSLVLYNTMGEEVDALVAGDKVNIAHLPKGLYHAVIARKKQTVSKKIITF